MANLVVHFEIHASEPQKLIDFYTELLGCASRSTAAVTSPTGSSTRVRDPSATLQHRRASASTVA
jgi:predicted enzyme related to lactoylglutathione lyase